MIENIKEYLSWAKFFILTALFEIWMAPSRILDWTVSDKWFKFRFRVWQCCYVGAFFLAKIFAIIHWFHWLILLERELDWRCPRETTKIEEQLVLNIAAFWSEETVEVFKRRLGTVRNDETVDFSFFQWISFWGKESQPIPVPPDINHGHVSCVNGDYEYHLISKGKRDAPLPIDRLMLEYNSRKIRDEFRMF